MAPKEPITHQDAIDATGGRVYGSVNRDLLALLGPIGRVLDVGCGDGSLGPELRRLGATELVGVEVVEEAAVRAEAHYRPVLREPVERLDLAALGGEPFDTIVAGDVLEHLVDPWRELARWRDWIAPAGQLAISVPNLRHIRVLGRLVLRGRFDYDPVGGVMDRTHLRWFTQRSLADQLEAAGWRAVRFGRPSAGRTRRLDRATGGRLSDVLVAQLRVVAEPT
jgi:2-polyprenyl-3-methyl-5-hydroxy-6-metoxy-1,4-benzoquinol methylase